MTYLYKLGEKKLFQDNQAKEALENGWFDCPTKAEVEDIEEVEEVEEVEDEKKSLKDLKNQAKELGIKFPNNIKDETLRLKISEAIKNA